MRLLMLKKVANSLEKQTPDPIIKTTENQNIKWWLHFLAFLYIISIDYQHVTLNGTPKSVTFCNHPSLPILLIINS